MATSRLFVALWLPDAVSQQLERALTDARQQHGDIAWQPRERWHVTLAFLGDRDERTEMRRFEQARVDQIGELRLRDFGAFGSIVWAGVVGDTRLLDAARRVRAACRVRDERRFRPHVTVARVRGSGSARVARDVLANMPDFSSDPWYPDQLCLVRSTAGPRPEYKTVARVRLPGIG